MDTRDETQDVVVILLEDVAVIVVGSLDKIESRADGPRLAEIERRSLDGANLARRHSILPRGKVVAGDDLQHVLVEAARRRPGEIPVRVIRQIEVRRLGRRRGVLHDELVRLGQQILDRDVQLPRKARLPVGTSKRELHADRGLALDLLGAPNAPVERVLAAAAVDVILARVRLELEGLPVDDELRSRDAIRETADDRAE